MSKAFRMRSLVKRTLGWHSSTRSMKTLCSFGSVYMSCMILIMFMILLNSLLTANMLHAAQMTQGF